MPAAQRLLLVFTRRGLAQIHRDPEVLRAVDGVSIRERLLTAQEHRWLKDRGMKTFAWTVNDGERMNKLVAQGVDGLITDRLDVMALLGGRREILG